MAIQFRSMTDEDIPRALEIESRSNPCGWSRQAFQTELRGRFSESILVLCDDTVAGFLLIRAVADEMEILNIAIDPDWRRRGLAFRLLNEGLRRGRDRGAESIFLEVRRSNRAAIALYEGLGFRETSVRRHYYKNGEDALIMTLTLRSA